MEQCIDHIRPDTGHPDSLVRRVTVRSCGSVWVLNGRKDTGMTYMDSQRQSIFRGKNGGKIMANYFLKF